MKKIKFLLSATCLLTIANANFAFAETVKANSTNNQSNVCQTDNNVRRVSMDVPGSYQIEFLPGTNSGDISHDNYNSYILSGSEFLSELSFFNVRNAGYGYNGWQIGHADVIGSLTITPSGVGTIYADKIVLTMEPCTKAIDVNVTVNDGQPINVKKSTSSLEEYTIDFDNTILNKYKIATTINESRTVIKTISVIAASDKGCFKISDLGYATYYTQNAYKIPDGVEAWAITNITGNELTFKKISTTVPKNTGVILKGSPNTYTYDITTDGEAVTSILKSGQNTTPITWETNHNYYVLSKNSEGKIGFYLENKSKSQFTIPSNKCYLDISNTNPAKGFSLDGLDDNTTSISDINFEKTMNGVVYNLYGQKVSTNGISGLKQGIYIINGKKIIINN